MMGGSKSQRATPPTLIISTNRNSSSYHITFTPSINNKMGRYYSGDIDGKFWFGVQDSDDANHFGGEEIEMLDEDTDEAYALAYSFTKEDLEDIDAGIQECIDELGDKLPKLEEYFGEGGKGYFSYNPQKMCEDFGLPTEGNSFSGGKEYQEMMEQYARLVLGKKIKECVERTGSCNFECEL